MSGDLRLDLVMYKLQPRPQSNLKKIELPLFRLPLLAKRCAGVEVV